MAKYKHITKNSGDTILAEEWNKIGTKLESINARLDEEGSLFNGPLTVSESITVKDFVNLDKDVVFGNSGKRFVIHSRGDNKDFLQISADKINGDWDWSNGITLRKSGDVGIANTNPMAKLDVNGNALISGELSVKAKISAANSDIYFTKTDHQHTGIGNSVGFAAIENDGNLYKTLMILGRNIGSNNNVSRQVTVWDDLTVARHLTVGGNLVGAAKDQGNTALMIRTGKTQPSDWQQYGDGGIFVNVDYSNAGFKVIPHVVVSLHGLSNHWSTTGGSSVYGANTNGFTVYIRNDDGTPLKVQYARDNGRLWHLHWIAIGI